MHPVAVIKHRYVLQDILLRFMASLIVPPLNTLLLQRTEEAFYYRIIPAVTFSTHTARDLVTVQQLPELSAGVLRTAI